MRRAHPGARRGVVRLLRFADRADAGRQLGLLVRELLLDDAVVLGLPRGGVPVALEVARAIEAPLDVLVVRKLGVPVQPDLAMGAIGEGGVRVLNAGVPHVDLDAVEARERVALDRAVQRYRGSRPPVPLEGRTAVVVDDGVATGATALSACAVARARGAAGLVLAVPVAPADWQPPGLAVVCVLRPSPFVAVGRWYVDFGQTSDEEVLACLG